MEKFQKPSNYLPSAGRRSRPTSKPSHNTQSRNLVKPSYTKTPTKELPEQGHSNQYHEPPGNPPYTAIYQYTKSPPTLHQGS